ncbi:DUF4834 family protein [Thalassobellus suaedae]|uniref:DUF4834 family protein n=1 Tax=Thalassobellus suaedae TaxID=3074124 RepID=A0ABY9Y2A4_9FLAO|nr:DUF4834 family protein [Flavobacteriaceae bacterium HL-DH14]WNH12196.1 DUF4834 family protein [Flavobacteriaceae bacterium HL-DH10]
MGLIRTILIIVVVYYVIKVLSRIFAPFMLKYAAKKAEERFGGQFGQYKNQRQQETSKKEGDITIDKMPNIKTSNKDVGDYVDYEEVE